jgi:hypothetical protein
MELELLATAFVLWQATAGVAEETKHHAFSVNRSYYLLRCNGLEFFHLISS